MWFKRAQNNCSRTFSSDKFSHESINNFSLRLLSFQKINVLNFEKKDKMFAIGLVFFYKKHFNFDRNNFQFHHFLQIFSNSLKNNDILRSKQERNSTCDRSSEDWGFENNPFDISGLPVFLTHSACQLKIQREH